MNKLYSIFEQCSGVTTDSRKVAAGNLFVALRGANFNGNLYAVKALEAGAAYAIVDEQPAADTPTDILERIVVVDDSLLALQALAAEHRQRLQIPILGIVGSNGKTTTKELVSRVLAERFTVYATRGNLNNHIGVPLTLLAMDSSVEFGVVEMGASAQGEIALLCSICRPNYGIITNIGNAHLEGFGGKEGIIKGKGELYDYLNANGGTAFVAQQDEVLTLMASVRLNMAVEPYPYTLSEGYKSNLSGEYNSRNIAAAVAVGRYFNIAPERIAVAIESYIPENNRSQEQITAHGNRLIIDCYNANPSSMEVAIANIASKEGAKLLILGDMLELGQWSESEHRRILELAASIGRVEMILVGEHFRRAAHSLALDAVCFKSTAEAAAYLAQSRLSNRTILLKGSRGIALEKLINYL
ncbi:MAG: UDP-N-acetylmuramoyl-tripeptide--D-alanyl-D-alanine ligase [Rikenellaceae bacterium]|nr:UDP-N-acetylmuramoyl-tripeptide--D-alanyl-D-alanine ligase [Rikenellaceae bacterium]